MKHFLLIYDLVDDYLERRPPLRDAHLAHARAAVERGELLAGGALDPAERAVLLFAGLTADAPEAFARADPYVLAGLVREWRVSEWITVVGPLAARPVSGV
jgi:uncharacterized protein YciI